MATKFTNTAITLAGDTKLAAETVAAAKGHTTPDAIRELAKTQDAALSAKAAPVDADFFTGYDSEASGVRKKFTWANIKAAMKTYFDALYVALTGNQTIAGIKSFSSVPKITAASPLTDGTDVLSIDGFLALIGSPKFLIFRDDFAGDANWNKMVTGTGSAAFNGYDGSHFGTMDIRTGGTSGSFAGICTFGFSNLWPLSNKPWYFTAIIKVDSITDLKLAIGFSNNGNSGNPDLWTVAFSGFDFQPALSANWRFRIDPAGGSPTYQDSGVAVAANTFYTLRMRSNGVDNQCMWSIDNRSETLATGMLDYAAGLSASITNTAASAKIALIDFVSFVGKTNR